MSLTIRLRLVGVLAALVLCAAPARADDPQRAKELFQQGAVFFDLGQFDKAIEVWQRAYAEKQDPGFLYNIGQAHRLSGDAKKAIFFYKSFLRNAPVDPKRREVEQKIADLQKQIEEGEKKGEPTPPPPRLEPPSSPMTPPAPAPAEQPPSVPDPKPAAVSEVPTGMGGPRQALPGNLPAPRMDVGVAPGISFWLAGIAGDVRPAFTFAATAGYTFDRNGRVRFRLGVALTGSFLKETGSRETFVSALVGPGIRAQMTDRLVLGADLGVGLLVLMGLRPTSALLAQDQPYDVNGAQPFFEVRPTLGIAYRLTPSWAVSFDPALAFSPKKANFYASLVRLELLGSLALRF